MSFLPAPARTRAVADHGEPLSGLPQKSGTDTSSGNSLGSTYACEIEMKYWLARMDICAKLWAAYHKTMPTQGYREGVYEWRMAWLCEIEQQSRLCKFEYDLALTKKRSLEKCRMK